MFKTDDHAYQLLSMWTTRRISTFLQDHLNAKCLPLITDATTLRDALESVTFFATSMGRVGADFSSMLQPIFQPRLVSIVTSHWSDGLNILENTLKVCRDTGIASPLYSKREVASNDQDFERDNIVSGEQDERCKTPAPPRQLLSHPPLARLVNAFLIGLNELRRCLLACAFPELRNNFRTHFVTKAKQLLVQNERSVLTPGFLNMKGEDAGKLRTLAVELKKEFDACVEPYLSVAIEVALGSFDNIPVKAKHDADSEEKIDSEADEGANAEASEEEEEGVRERGGFEEKLVNVEEEEDDEIVHKEKEQTEGDTN